MIWMKILLQIKKSIIKNTIKFYKKNLFNKYFKNNYFCIRLYMPRSKTTESRNTFTGIRKLSKKVSKQGKDKSKKN